MLVVALDEPTYRELGLSHIAPLPRGILGELLEKLREGGAEAAFLDFIFRDPGPSQADNQRLVAGLHSIPTFIGAFDYVERDAITKTATLIQVLPQPDFQEAAARVTKVNLMDIPSVRSFTQPKREDSNVLPVPYSYAQWARIERMPTFYDLINYYGPPGTIPTVSIYKVLRNDRAANERLFKGAFIIVGSTLATGLSYTLKDSFVTPTSTRVMSGVEIHATVLGNMRSGDWIHRTSLATECTLLSAVILVVSGVIFTMPAGPAVVFYTMVTAVWSVWAYAWFLTDRFLPGLLAFYVILPLVVVVAILAKHRTLKGRMRYIGDMLGISDRVDES
jgi:CHASE2 domain-containing sensor protein